jgi:hypothetical protein
MSLPLIACEASVKANIQCDVHIIGDPIRLEA